MQVHAVTGIAGCRIYRPCIESCHHATCDDYMQAMGTKLATSVSHKVSGGPAVGLRCALRELHTHHTQRLHLCRQVRRSAVQQGTACCCIHAGEHRLPAATGKPDIRGWIHVAAQAGSRASNALLAIHWSSVTWPVQPGGPTEPQAGPSKRPPALPPAGQVMQQAMTG